MRILICASEAPLPPPKGLRMTLAALLKYLRRTHDVRVLAFHMPEQVDPPDDAGDWLRLIPHPSSTTGKDARLLARAMLARRPLRADVLAEHMAGPLGEELERFDPEGVIVTTGRLACLAPYLEDRPTLLWAMDARHLNLEAKAAAASWLRGALLRGEANRVRHFEATEYPRFGRVVISSEDDRASIEELGAPIALQVIPLGVDAEVWAPEEGAVRDPNRIVFHAHMGYPPNVQAADYLARSVFPRVRAAHPEARLALVGRDPAPEVQSLAALEGVEVTGEVPDVRPWLWGSRVWACTMQNATGIKTKLLEAMAAELPCVVNPLAARGVDIVPGVHMLVGNTEEELAQHLVHMLTDERAAQAIGRAAREFVCDEHDWRAVVRAFERIFHELSPTERSGSLNA